MTQNQLMHAFLQECVNLDLECSRAEHVPAQIQKWRDSFATVRDLRRKFDVLVEPIDEVADELHTTTGDIPHEAMDD